MVSGCHRGRGYSSRLEYGSRPPGMVHLEGGGGGDVPHTQRAVHRGGQQPGAVLADLQVRDAVAVAVKPPHLRHGLQCRHRGL
jgi:hypothetical protein